MTTATTTAAVTSPNTGLRVDASVHGSDGTLWWKYTTNRGPRGLTGTVSAGTSHPERNLRSLHRQQAASTSLYKGQTALCHKWSTNGGTQWSNWGSLGGKLGSGPAAVSQFTVGVIDVFVRGSDGAARQKTYNHSWSSWKSVGGQVASGTASAVSQTLWLMVRGTDHQLWQKNVGSSGAAYKLPGAASTSTFRSLTGRRLHCRQ
ncbi:MAG TPA: hypothetical protein VEF35_01410 [Candidatus Bathyarchaeia archaeon]|nr:hypothetical protein [Candidatus Bathyarchaeia archaeon]